MSMYNHRKINALLNKVVALENAAIKTAAANSSLLHSTHPAHAPSAKNLLHYLSLRSNDMRSLQRDLSHVAVSSLSHSEAYTLNNLQKIHYLLGCLAERPDKNKPDLLDAFAAEQILKQNSEGLLGTFSFRGQTKIMVTLPTEAGSDYSLVHNLVKAGMSVARINTAHDNESTWGQMLRHVRKAEKALGKKVKIFMDTAGPKIRTGAITPPAETDSDDNRKTPFIQLYKGSTLKIMREDTGGHGGASPAISVTAPDIFEHVKRNDSIWFDDGRLGGIVLSKNGKGLQVSITHAPEDGFRLKAEKGVNFPDSSIHIPALTRHDLGNLPFIAAHADMVGYSFVQTPGDIYLLQKHLKRLKREDIGIVLKIETHMAFENFPSLLFAVMRSRNCGIMIARGDLAVDIGYNRLAEVQEEILWLAEAAHLPVIWATQVLETLVKKGIATRAEISDVVKSVRAECVMLNKGPHILDAIAVVRDIDKKMAAHEEKKYKILRPLHVAKTFLDTRP